MDRRAFLRFAGMGVAASVIGTGTAVAGGNGFETSFDGDGWEDWAKDGVSNLRVAEGAGVVEAATNIYPSDRRAAVFRRDRRARDGHIRATVSQVGVGPGLVLRRTGPETYYAVVYERERGTLDIVARVDGDETVLERRPVGVEVGRRARLTFVARGTDPTRLEARLAPAAQIDAVRVGTTDATDALQRAGDPGVLGTAETGFRAGPDWRTPLGTQSARAIWVTDPFHSADSEDGLRDRGLPVDQSRQAATEQTSTTAFDSVEFTPFREPGVTAPSTVAATSLRPETVNGRQGALVSVVADVPCEVAVEVARDPSFEASTTTDPVPVNEYDTAFVEVPVPRPGERFHWRPRLRRDGVESVGPIRSAPAFPPRGRGDEVSLAIGSCATQFGPTFDSIADYDPDAFIWHGDLNYLDASGPLAQTKSGFAGMWKDLLAVDELQPILDRSYFCTQRDDHDYGENDMYGEQIEPYGVEPYERVLNPSIYYRFGGGLVDIFVPDDRRFRDDPSLPDDEEKTLLGAAQRRWLLDGLRESTAPFKIVASPGPLFNVPNDSTSWAKGYTTERDRVLDVVASEVDGRTVFVTGDTHSGCVTRFESDKYGAPGDRLDFLEVRAAPLDIPGPGQHDASSGDTVVYSEQGKFFSTLAVRGDGADAVLDIELRENDGTVAWGDTLRAPR